MSCPSRSVLPFADRRSLLRWTAGDLVLVVVLVVVWWARPWPTSAQLAAHRAPVYRPPVTAPILDPFRPPTTPYGPGNRGIEYATVPGMSVRAAADGLVVFAGPVAGGLHVTVRHDDGIRTSYSFLAAIRVRQGLRLAGGDVVGVAAAVLHVGARRGDTYIDPASLWGRPVGPADVYLVPLDGDQAGPAPPTVPGSKGRWLGGWVGPGITGLGMGALPGVGAGFGARGRR